MLASLAGPPGCGRGACVLGRRPGDLRHTAGSAESCCLPALTRFTGCGRTGPGRHLRTQARTQAIVPPRRRARAAESARLESVCGETHRGFESHRLRQMQRNLAIAGCRGSMQIGWLVCRALLTLVWVADRRDRCWGGREGVGVRATRTGWDQSSRCLNLSHSGRSRTRARQYCIQSSSAPRGRERRRCRVRAGSGGGYRRVETPPFVVSALVVRHRSALRHAVRSVVVAAPRSRHVAT